jgi:NAD(P)-dependent dehydrogenase (short-subunit alcohol dehydrogenase family)
MDLKLNGKLAVITGSTKGIGFATARLMDAEGAKVIVNGRSEEHVKEALGKLSDKAEGVAGDLASGSGVEDFIAGVRKIGDPDILINNLGIFEPKDFFEITDQDWFTFFETNVMSGVRLSRAFMPGMLERGWGRIVFLSSESGLNIPSEMVHYGMTKTAQLAVSRGLAELTTGTGVTVNSVLPGPTWSEGVGGFVEELAGQEGMDTEKFVDEVFFKQARPTSIIKRFAEPGEVASMIAYVASPLASATNGGALRVDGGTVKSIVP